MPKNSNPKRHRLTGPIIKQLQESAKLNYSSPFMQLTGEYVEFSGKEYKAHLEKSGHTLPEGFNEENVYPVPEAKVMQFTKGILFQELKKVFAVKGVQGVQDFISDLRQKQQMYADHYSGKAE